MEIEKWLPIAAREVTNTRKLKEFNNDPDRLYRWRMSGEDEDLPLDDPEVVERATRMMNGRYRY